MMPGQPWWKRGIVYQVYPRSFQDTDGDGVGDLAGITRRLGYLAGLGIDAVWISPVFPSPMADFGYDVADYCGIDPLFGSLADADALIGEAHRLGLRIVFDIVPNHTSDQHPWFRDSRASRDNPKRDWYIWRDGKADGAPPNNWLANFGGSAWTWDAASGQFYLHSFLAQQPDLNWRNPAVRAAMFSALRFWLDRGVDGFRVDVMWLMVKDAALRDNPPNPGYRPGEAAIDRLLQVYSADQPEVHEVVAEMRGVLDAYADRVLIGEIYLPLDRVVTYYGANLRGAQLPFNFKLIETAWTAAAVGALIEDYERLLPPGAWPNWVLGNHDQKRIAARVGAAQARVALMLLLTLRGTPTLYYGDEIGIGPVAIPPDQAQDPWEKTEPGLGRDPSRTPMAWDASDQGGFTTGHPWLPLHADHARQNVAVLDADPGSILALTRALIALRRDHPALAMGSIRVLSATDDVLVYERRLDAQHLVVALNLAAEERAVPTLPELDAARLLHSTIPAGAAPRTRLRADEGLILQLS